MSATTYRVWGQGRKRLIAVSTLFLVGGVALVVASSAGSQPPVWFAVLYLALAVVNVYLFQFTIAYRLDLDGGTLRWEMPLRSGSVSIADIAELRPARLGSGVEVIVLRDGTRVSVMARKGFAEFVTALHQATPGVPVRLGRVLRASERLPGPSSLRQTDDSG